MATRFSELDYSILTALYKTKGALPMHELADLIGVDQAKVSAACLWFADEGFIDLAEDRTTIVRIGDEGRRLHSQGFPERRALEIIEKEGGQILFSNVASALSLDKAGAGEVIKWVLAKRWCEKKDGYLAITDEGRRALEGEGEDEKLVRALAAQEQADLETLQAEGIAVEEALRLLKSRPRAVKVKEKVIRKVSLSERGAALVSEGIEREKPEVTELTQTLLTTGKWREVTFKAYDVNLPSAPLYPGKIHPLQRIVDETRRCFFEMGFTEVVSPHVESSFWDFDALFQPQDHPAREMQDTFYVKRPAESELPETEMVEAVKATHENGGATGSLGWRYTWDEAKARRNVLRTHLTAATIRHVAHDPQPPQKVFHIGRVFRREKITFKHGAEFTQVDGIIIDKSATFATLLGTLEKFYHKMGFEEIKFRPAFFPYTEPSVEVFVRMEQRGDWIELGGAGVFRPEVTVPFGCPCPVLAWGLGLERLTMMRIGIDDLRKLYLSDLEWLKEVQLCR
jgi:phenylalanyl-tRNA synthetase alpha chain